MSVAFTKEEDYESVAANLPDRPISPHPNLVTPEGLALIEAALATARHRFREDDYERLGAALALIFGPESMIVFRDVLGVDPATARTLKSWAGRAPVRAALQDSASSNENRVDADPQRACP